MAERTPQDDTMPVKANFEGHQPRECGEHRTVGPHRAWCHDCSMWCYPNDPCFRCTPPNDAVPAIALDPERVDRALRAVLANLDYDLHKALEHDEETGRDTYHVPVAAFIAAYDEEEADRA